jgi:MFS family permease
VVNATQSRIERSAAPPAARDRLPIAAALTASAISLTGNALTALAIPWFVYVTTGSAARTGVVAFAQMVPVVLASFFGGALADRVGRKQLSITADALSGLTVGAVPLLYHTVGLAFWQLVVLVFLGAVLDTPGSTARQAMQPELAERAGMSLERANAASHVIQSASMLVGPALAGVLIAALGASNVLWIDAVSFAISAVIFAVFVPASAPHPQSGDHYLDEVMAGLRFLRGDRALWTLLLLAAVLNFVGAPLFAVVLPVYVKETYDNARDLGFLIAGFGAGAIVSAAAYGAIGPRLPRWATTVAMLVVASAAFCVTVLLPPLVIAVLVFAVVGIANGTINPLITTILQERTPPELLGRVFGSVAASSMVAAPAGMLLAGLAIDAAGLRAVLGAIAAAFVVVTLVFLVQPSLKGMDRLLEETG